MEVYNHYLIAKSKDGCLQSLSNRQVQRWKFTMYPLSAVLSIQQTSELNALLINSQKYELCY